MPEPLLYLKSMGAAAVVSAIAVLTMAVPRRRTNSAGTRDTAPGSMNARGAKGNGEQLAPTTGTAWPSTVCTLGIGLGFVAGCHTLSFRLSWPPVNGLDRLIVIVLPVALGIELIAGFRCIPLWLGWLLRLSLAVLTPRILLHGSVYLSGSGDGWTQWQTISILAAGSALLAIVWGLLSWLSFRSPGASIPTALCLATQCAGVTIMMAGYIQGGAAAVPLVGALIATTLAARFTVTRADLPASYVAPVMTGIGVAGLFGLLFIGHFFGRLSAGSALTMLLAPLLCWVTETPPLRHQKPWLVGLVRLALVAIPLAAVLAMAKQNFDRNMAPLM